MTADPPITHADFDRTVNAVDDLGWDPNGSDPISIPYEDDLCIDVPPGTYRVEQTQSGAPVKWGLVGTGKTPDDVTFVGPGHALRVLQLTRGSRDILVENVAFDHGDSIKGCLGNAFLVEDGLSIKDVHYVGTTPSEHTGATSLLPVYIFEADGVAVLDGIEMCGPSELVDYPKNPLAIFSGNEHTGTVYIQNSRFENRGEHAIYASRCEGDIRIENCWFKNNQNTQARISGEGSYCKDSKFVWDLVDHPNTGSFQATTGLTLEAGYKGFTGGFVENCEFVCTTSSLNSGCLKIDGSHGAAAVRNCEFLIEDDVSPVIVRAPGDSHMIDGLPLEPHDVTFENNHVTSTGEPDDWGDAAMAIDGRDGSTLTDCCIAADGRDALSLTGGAYTVSGGAISATGDRGRIVGDGEVELTNVTEDTDCRLPGEDTISSDSGSPGSSDSPGEYAHTLTVKAPRHADPIEFTINVSGGAALLAEADTGDEFGDTVTPTDDGTRIHGWVGNGGIDDFAFDGEIVSASYDGAKPRAKIDGEAIDLADYEAAPEPAPEPEPEPVTVTIGTDGAAGCVEPILFYDGEITDGPGGVSYTHYPNRGTIVFSTRSSWTHEFVLDGTITDVALPDGVTVTIDGTDWTAN